MTPAERKAWRAKRPRLGQRFEAMLWGHKRIVTVTHIDNVALTMLVLPDEPVPNGGREFQMTWGATSVGRKGVL